MSDFSMKYIDEDIKATGQLVNGESSIYKNIYYCTNEMLNAMFKNTDIRGKNILSVLASGDQCFYFLKHGAKNVDLFDVNKLTIYYFYLRIWLIRYINEFYLSADKLNSQCLADLLDKVNPKTEKEMVAYDYWKKYLDKYYNAELCNLFQGSIYVSKYPKVGRLKGKLKRRDFNFYNIDLSKPVNLDVKYDYIYVSNIIEWIEEKHDGSLTIFKDNMNKLLNSGGMVLCSSIYGYRNLSSERKMFENDFEFRTLPDYACCDDVSDLTPTGYAYVKK